MTGYYRNFRGLILSCTFILLCPLVEAQWSNNPAINTAICTNAGTQFNPVTATDGAGGMIVAWADDRNGSYKDVYAQLISASGVLQWPSGGVAICTAAGAQTDVRIASDGSGGAVITWTDNRTFTGDNIYAQRINASGAVQWTADGIAICTSASTQSNRAIISDGSGGAILTWEDLRNLNNRDIYAQRINTSGAALWTTDGVAICTAGQPQTNPVLCGDGSSGAVLAWEDFRTGNDRDIYAQKIDASGTVQWTANGVAICTSGLNQFVPAILGDGSGGAFIVWEDYRMTQWDIYAQRIGMSGSVSWTANGVVISAAANNQMVPVLASDGAGGAIVAWEDVRGGTYYDIYAQRFDPSGAVQWTSNGVAVSTSSFDQRIPAITEDGSGGAIIAWYDFRGGSNYDIYAQRLAANGTSQWTTNGSAMSTAGSNQTYPLILFDGIGGALLAWTDLRNGNADIYAAFVSLAGALPVELGDCSAVTDGSETTIRWTTITERNNYGFEVEGKTVEDPNFRALGFVMGSGTSNTPRQYCFKYRNASSGLESTYRLKQIDRDGLVTYSREMKVVPIENAGALIRLDANFPNPFFGHTEIHYAVHSETPAFYSVALFDMTGRLVRLLEEERFQPNGDHWMSLDAAGLRQGHYVLSVSGNGSRASRVITLQ